MDNHICKGMSLPGKLSGLLIPSFPFPVSMLEEQMFLYHTDLHTIDLHQPGSVHDRYLYPKDTALWGVEMAAQTEKKKRQKKKLS